jgi:hypothetical protein
MKQLLALAAVVLSLGGCMAPPVDRGHQDQSEDQGDWGRGSEQGRRPGPGEHRGDGYGPDGRWDSRNCIPDRGC